MEVPAPIRIVFLDDDPDTLSTLSLLADLDGGFEVLGAVSNVAELAALARSVMPDVVVVDHRVAPVDIDRTMRGHHARGEPRSLDDMSGLEAVALLRSIRPDGLIVVYTGLPGLATSAANAGADLYVEKGDPAALLATIKEHRG